MNYYRIGHSTFAIGLALFFMYSGVKKFIPRKAPAIQNEEMIRMAEEKKANMVKAVQDGKYSAPVAFNLVVKALSGSGYLKFVGIVQIVSSILILIPLSRLLGLILLLPVIVNIFMFHVVMDNRISENIETGLLVLLNIVLISFYRLRFNDLLIKKLPEI